MTRAAPLLALLAGCAATVQPDAGRDVRAGRDGSLRDAPTFDMAWDDAAEAEVTEDATTTLDVVLEAARDTRAEGGLDVRDGRVADSGTDAPEDVPWEVPELPDEGIAPVPCEGPADGGPPPGVGRSCAPGTGVDPEHCREVHYCGGAFPMGSWLASYVGFGFGTSRWVPNGMTLCEEHTGVAQSGYVDAYEVTVARIRPWVRAGMPRPPVGADYFYGHRWIDRLDPIVVAPDRADYWETQPNVPVLDDRSCTYTPEPGPNDARPVNCVTFAAALAFCWWDGKHLATEVGWEYVARNRGATATPWGAVAARDDECTRGDLGAFNGRCAPAMLPQPVGTHPRGATFDPRGVHDLMGGLSEYVLSDRITYGSLECMFPRRPPPSYDGGEEGIILRGNAWYLSTAWHDAMSHAASRQDGPFSGSDGPARHPAVGFRCMRWEREPRGASWSEDAGTPGNDADPPDVERSDDAARPDTRDAIPDPDATPADAACADADCDAAVEPADDSSPDTSE